MGAGSPRILFSSVHYPVPIAMQMPFNDAPLRHTAGSQHCDLTSPNLLSVCAVTHTMSLQADLLVLIQAKQELAKLRRERRKLEQALAAPDSDSDGDDNAPLGVKREQASTHSGALT